MTGGLPHVAAWNTTRFEYLRAHPDEARGFDAMMANFPDNRHPAIAAAYDFSGLRLIADVGGGNGAALRYILSRFTALRGLLYDRDDVVNAIQPADLLGGRIELSGGNFFTNVPGGADVYMLIRVLHDWPGRRLSSYFAVLPDSNGFRCRPSYRRPNTRARSGARASYQLFDRRSDVGHVRYRARADQ